ncbi:MAG: allophanate hydrolase [Betaproteobacteria bacterium]|nr:allophanate hydrolase [Betaproteobacteria bacterium]
MDLSITNLRQRYLRGELKPSASIEEIAGRTAEDPNRVWIHRLPVEKLREYAKALDDKKPETLPLYGIPFAIKDNIDLAGVSTTAACPAFAYTPKASAVVVQRLIDAGAIPIGKTNLDQFATGLVGTRSPYGACRNSFNPDYISGGSSSGSAVAVAAGFDAADPFSRAAEPYGFDFGAAPTFRFGVPKRANLHFFDNAECERLFRVAVEELEELGGSTVEIDLQPFLDAARLLYDGPWVAERYAAIREFFDDHADALFPVTREIIGKSRNWLAADAYAALYKLRELKRLADKVWTEVDVVVTPTAGTIYTIAELEANPIQLNSNLRYYTNFMNLLDYAATAVPTGFEANGLPLGVTLFAPAHQDVPLLRLASKLQRACVNTAGATNRPLPAAEPVGVTPSPSGQVKVAVCGAHLSGLPLNHQLLSRGARLVSATSSAPHYKLYALPGGPPHRPGMVRGDGGKAIELEVWELPAKEFGSFVAGIAAPLGIGTIELADGSRVQGFVCEAHAAAGATDITVHGGWRAWLAAKDIASP